MEELRLQLLDKTIALYSWSPECIDILRAVADRAPSEFGQKMACLEAWVGRSVPDEPDRAAQKELEGEEWCRLYEVIVGSDPLCELFVLEPLFSKARPAVISNYARFADIRPDVETVFRTADALFMRVLRLLLGPVPPTTNSILHADFTQLITLYSAYPKETVWLLDFAQPESFHHSWSALEQTIGLLKESPNQAGVAYQDDEILAPARKILAAKPNISEKDLKPLADLLLRSPLISTMDPRELLIFGKNRDALPKADELLKKTDDGWSPDWNLEKRSSFIAKKALESSRFIKPDELNPLELSWDLRIETIRHFLELRRYAKLDALSYKWPRLSVVLRNDRQAFFDFEKLMTSTEPDTTGDDSLSMTNKLIRQYAGDETLGSFLRLRPFFREVSEQEIRVFDEASSAIVPIAPTQAQVVPQLGHTESVALPVTASEEYRNIYLTIGKQKGSRSGTRQNRYTVKISTGGPGSPEEETETASIPIPASFAVDLAARLRQMPPGLVSMTFGKGSPTRNPAQAVPLPQQKRVISPVLQEIGTEIYDRFFADEKVKKRLLDALGSSHRCRIVLELTASELAVLPWETIYVTEQHLFLSLIGSFSLVRYYRKNASLFPVTPQTPLKILALFSSPTDLPPLPIEQDEQVLSETLSDAIGRGQVELQILRHPTINDLQHALRMFRPHVFHFDGHGAFSPDGTEGALIFEGAEQRQAQLVQASVLKTHLADSGIGLVILDACDTGSAPTNEHVTGLAGSLVDAGIPAAIATTRPVYVEPSAIFTREFYSSLVDGYPLEAAVVEARKALSAGDWDWSPYALFVSNTKDLNVFRLAPSPVRQRRESAPRANVEGNLFGQSLQRQRAPSPQKIFSTGYALVIGAGGDLPTTIDDARAVAEILTAPDQGGYPPSQVHLLYDRGADRESILQEIDSLARNTAADSTVIVFFSGHGYRAAFEQVARYYLVPNGCDRHDLERTAISVDEFSQRLRAIPARKLLVLLDCAHAGGMIEEIAPEIGFEGKLSDTDLGEQGRVIIAAARASETAYAGRPYSAFTHAVLEVLSGVRGSTSDGYIRVFDLATHVQEVVPQRTGGRQHPVVHFERGDNFAVANAPIGQS